MSDIQEEIKQILKDMDLVANKNKVPIYYSQNDIKIVLDYITNLQEENKKLKELCDKYEEEHSTKFNEWVFDKRENERLKQIIKDNTILVKDENENYQECNINPLDYKSRNEKAIEYIKQCQLYGVRSGKTLYNKAMKEVINILQGSDKE